MNIGHRIFNFTLTAILAAATFSVADKAHFADGGSFNQIYLKQ